MTSLKLLETTTIYVGEQGLPCRDLNLVMVLDGIKCTTKFKKEYCRGSMKKRIEEIRVSIPVSLYRLSLTGLEGHIYPSLVKGLEGHICPCVVTSCWRHCDVI